MHLYLFYPLSSTSYRVRHHYIEATNTMHAKSLLILLPVLASASAIHSAASASASTPVSAASPSATAKAHAPNTGNSYGTDGISNKGNLACMGKCVRNPIKLHCPPPYVSPFLP